MDKELFWKSDHIFNLNFCISLFIPLFFIANAWREQSPRSEFPCGLLNLADELQPQLVAKGD